jgi:hypothetical protein
MGDSSSTLPFRIPVFVLFPGGPQGRERLRPRGAVCVGGRATRAIVRTLPVGRVYLGNQGSVGAVDGFAPGRV